MTAGLSALSIRQPWLDCILLGDKRVENRTWGWPASRPYGMVALHASREPDLYATPPVTPRPGWLLDRARFGAVLGIATVTGCHCGYGCCGGWAVSGQHHWLLDGVRPLPEPVPCKGRLGLWMLPDDVEAKVRSQL